MTEQPVVPELRRQPGSLPYPDLRAGTDTIPKIDHIVVLMMENHSYDNKLGMLGRVGADGFTLGPDGKPTATNPYAGGDVQHAFAMPTTCQLRGKPEPDLAGQPYPVRQTGAIAASSSQAAGLSRWDTGRSTISRSTTPSRASSPSPTGTSARSSAPTFPNRRYLISATSLGMINDTVPGFTSYPPNGTIFDRLDHAGISWKDYCSTLGVVVSTTELYPELLPRTSARTSSGLTASSPTPRLANCRASPLSSRTTCSDPKKTRRTSRSASTSPPRSSTRSWLVQAGSARC